jgi:hypothetical protein
MELSISPIEVEKIDLEYFFIFFKKIGGNRK